MLLWDALVSRSVPIYEDENYLTGHPKKKRVHTKAELAETEIRTWKTLHMI